ncbi:sodium/pantothenate symporter [Fictibacillus macauensis ZFHKF-1]|uniref:Sodium/pantothenate symporter n=1 Tax=Fictibacillus macauensis ZFHKF-1 TaxID=1196324 RepID=I8AEX7_9BACL|nr:sodium:solute symporter [Fictibacillus macauensis]EIT83904.1 sodium/pantothenate symporter [Fictibacillus macauensis ZFHKF-1]
MNSSLVILGLFLVLSLVLGIVAKKGKDMNLEQWSVGGRGFGTLFVFLLMAGEIYTTFTFLGGSGWAYSKGGPALYILVYGALAYAISYFLLPAIWNYANQHKLVSQSDFFVSKFKSPYLGVFVSLVGIVAMIPYLVLQLKGLGIIVSEASYGKISSSTAVWIGVLTITVYVMISGIHGSAWTAALKDLMILGIVVFLGIYLPLHYYGGFQPMFASIQEVKPQFLTLPSEGMSISWFISTVLLTAFGFYMWPHTFASAFTAKSAKVFRKNAVFMPLYSLVLLFVMFVGFAAVLKVPGLQGAAGDLSLFKLTLQTFDPWVIGLIGAAGLLTALVPGSMILMAASTLFAKNVFKVIVPSATEKRVAILAKWLVPVIALIAVYFTLQGGEAIVMLLLMGYSLVTQLFPPLLFSLGKTPLVNKYGAFAGVASGVAIVAYVYITGTTIAQWVPMLPQVIKDLNIGIIALFVNLLLMFTVSIITRTASQSTLKEMNRTT